MSSLREISKGSRWFLDHFDGFAERSQVVPDKPGFAWSHGHNPI